MTASRTTAGERDLRRLRTLYKALGDETRLRIIGLMAELAHEADHAEPGFVAQRPVQGPEASQVVLGGSGAGGRHLVVDLYQMRIDISGCL